MKGATLARQALVLLSAACLAVGSQAGVSAAPDPVPSDGMWLIDAPEFSSHGSFTSAVREIPGGFTSALASWNASTANGGWMEMQLRARIGRHWTRWYDMGHWSRDLASGKRRSVKGQQDGDGTVDTDTLNLKRNADAVQARVLMHRNDEGLWPKVSLLAVATELRAADSAPVAVHARAWGTDLSVPERSQRTARSSPDEFGGGGDAWCSPTSVSMVMAYWARTLHRPQWDVNVETAAEGTYDPVYDGCGNWPFNVAFASEHGLRGWVQRLTDLSSIEGFIAAGVPVVASIRAAAGELDGAPYRKTDGHLLVVRGFTPDGDVVVNDPYGLPGSIRRVYARAQFERAWLGGSRGLVYLIAPPGRL